VGLTQDPYWETADTDTSNNSWPRKASPSRLELFKTSREQPDMMKDYNEKLKTKDAAKDKAAATDAQKAE